MKIAIIGAGIAGIAASIRMAVKGHDIDVFEANDYPGGKLSAFDQGGYRFDAGPSLFTMPQYVDELFRLAGKKPEDFFVYDTLDLVCNYFWDDSTRLHAWSDPQRFAQEVAATFGVPESQLLQILEEARFKYELTGKTFLEKNLYSWRTWLTREVGAALLKISKLDVFQTMNGVHERYFSEPKMVQLFNRFATYNGSNPYKAPGLLSMIPHFEHGIGAFYPKGGMVSITNSLYQLALSLGVRFHFSEPVTQIVVEQKKVRGIRTAAQGLLPFDRVISNMDVFFTYHKLLPELPRPHRILRQEKSTSALIFYWGIRRSFPELHLHNILFSNNYKEEFAQLQAGKVFDDPTVYINISSKCSPEDAPPGCENWFTMVNVPYNAGQDWDTIIVETRKRVLEKVSHNLGTDIEALLENESVLEPRSIEHKTSSHLGALYGTSSNNPFAAFLRHPNFSKQVQGLYFCGGSVHPGGGIPLALLSAKIVAELT
ncbi:MAG: NAD(P)/FAD-dependent oxidoreductase [Saprospiraceae bacterium]|nr:NAD(P)/FAD-dependent oxidoreductase [Saprospiraceae bacterium]MDP4820944.1 NAD(P)/FAD-dependent oxidoreductase [Saprospiraceae bacterium]MDP4997658.1 NAD(P)/FAD-dependent oxidoreductase [Saprospiraceae bacterium]